MKVCGLSSVMVESLEKPILAKHSQMCWMESVLKHKQGRKMCIEELKKKKKHFHFKKVNAYFCAELVSRPCC